MTGKSWLFFAICIFLWNIPATASAAQGDFHLRRIEFSYKIRSGSQPISGGLSGLSNIGGIPQKWGMITVHYNSRPRWADDVTLKYYVLVRDKRGKASMFTGNVTYVSVKAGLDHAGYIFLHPNSLERYGSVRRILVELWYQGVLEDSKQWPHRSLSRWWNKVPATLGALRTRFFSPFEHDFEVYEEDIKVVLP